MPSETKRAVTIHDVAKKAGVSFKTVSRVLNNEANVSAETREKVRKAISALQYSPSIAARVLAGSRSFLVGLLYDTPSSYYTHSVQMGALERCREAGFHLVLEKCNSEARDAAATILVSIKHTRLDGVILTPPLSDNQAVRESLVGQKIPHVLISPPKLEPGVSSVTMDDRRAAFDMTQYLISLGHRRIGFIKGLSRHGAAMLRLLGYEDALRSSGIELDEDLVKDGNFRFQSGADAAEQLLRRKERPTAIFASNDEMGAGVVATAHRLGISIPRELSVVGFDDVPYASITWPALTTVHQPIAEMGAAAAGLLIAGIQSRKSDPDGAAPSISFRHEMKIRGSTGPAP
ncbi:MAG TPA: LacI family DNA-binding transcriptional regulator [Rhizomicrobium sp.]|jgi:LacI family transcriptional regulator